MAYLALADAVDAFCEGIGFTSEQTRRLFEAATRFELPVKLHAEQLSNLHGAALMVISTIAFTTNDSLIKLASQTLPLSQAMLIRGVMILALLSLVARRDGGVLWWPHAARDRLVLVARAAAEGLRVTVCCSMRPM